MLFNFTIKAWFSLATQAQAQAQTQACKQEIKDPCVCA